MKRNTFHTTITMLVALPTLASALVAQQAPISPALTIQDAVQTALAHNTGISALRSDTQAARAGIDLSRAGYFPQLSLAANYLHIDTLPTFVLPGAPAPLALGVNDNIIATVSARQALFTSGRVQALVSRSEALYDADIARLASTEADVARQTREAYYSVLLAGSLVTSSEKNLTAAQSQLNDAQARFSAGTAAKFDVLRAQTSVSQAQQNLTQSRNQVELARVQLDRVMGMPLDSVYTLTDPGLAPVPTDQLPTLIETAEKQRSEILAARSQLAAYKAGIKVARSGYGPEVDLQAGYQYVENQNPEAVSTWTAGVGISWSIFDGGQTKANVLQAKALTQEAQANLKDTTESIEQDVRTQYLNLQTARQTIDTANTLLAQATEAYDVAVVRYDSGVGTATEQADALAQLTSARTSLDQARFNYNTAYARLQRALGLVTY
jgi:TolC family type I secretion outer membrane protein